MPSVLGRSFALLRGHPVLGIALGTAIVLSVCAMLPGLGVVAAPWFVCELLGVQLAASGRNVASRGRPWLSASLIVLVMLVVAAAAGWLAMLGFGPDMATADAADAPLPWPDTVRRVVLVVGSCTLAVLFLAPFVHTPLILLDRGGRVGGAMMESAALVRATGFFRHLRIAVAAQVLTLAPPVIAGMFVARTFERAATPLGFLVALPAMPLSIALGLGLVTATYVETADALGDARRAQRLDALPRLHRFSLATLLAAPVLGLMLLAASAFWQAPPIAGVTSKSEAAEILEAGDERTLAGTTLTLRTSERDIDVIAGLEPPWRVPRAWDAPLHAVVIRRAADDYSIEAITGTGPGSRSWFVRVDRAGVRVDDSVRASLIAHLSGWLVATFVASVSIVALFAIRAFAPLGVARARAARQIGTRSVDADAQRESFRTSLALLPFALAALLSGALAFLRV